MRTKGCHVGGAYYRQPESVVTPIGNEYVACMLQNLMVAVAG